MTKDYYYLSLLIKKWEDKLNREELERLNTWLSASNSNSTFAEELKKSWELSKKYELPFELDEKKAFDNVINKIDGNTTNTSTAKIINTKQSLFRTLMVAASLLLVSVFAWWLYSSNQNQTIIANGNLESVLLPDSSKVWLNKNSKLIFSNSFSVDKRLVKLSGEAYFEVKRDTTRPFIVETNKAYITVLGTSFNVKANSKYEKVDVIVKTGKVKLESIFSHHSVILTPKEIGVLDIKTGEITIGEDKNLNSIAWKRKMLIFDDTPLTDLIKDIEHNYNVKIDIENKELLNCPFTGRFDTDKKIESILKDVSIVLKMDKIIKVSQSDFILKGGICK